MNVLLLGDYANDGRESMRRFVAVMQRGLIDAGHSVQVVRPRPAVGRLKAAGAGIGKWLGYVDKLLIFPRTLRTVADWADVAHICDQANAMYVKCLRRPTLVTCHDVFAIRSALGEVEQSQTGWTGRRLQGMILNGLRRSQRIACVSEATRCELLRVGGVDSTRISVVPNALNYPYRPMPRNEAWTRLRDLGVDPTAPYLLHVGGNQWYKNRVGTLRIFEQIRRRAPGRSLKLVMVGKPWTPEMREFVSRNKLGSCVLECIGVQEEDLRALYSEARLMLFPSIAEGFGWPIIEAQACGCPVATSNRAPMTEIVGGAAVLIEPEDYEGSAEKVAGAFGDLAGLREAGLINAQRFSTPAMIAAYADIYGQMR